MATNILNCKHRSPRILLTPLRLPSVYSLHLPGVSGKKLFTTTKVSRSPLHFGSPNSKPQSVSNLGRTAKSFRLANRINRRFSKISMCNAREMFNMPPYLMQVNYYILHQWQQIRHPNRQRC